ncbi:MAG: hypothetical protein VW397_03140 [Candidatus Margulisiibacteriota bacterium]
MKFLTSIILSILCWTMPGWSMSLQNTTFGLYTEFPLSNGIFAEYQLNTTDFFKIRYGYSPEYYMNALGDILSLFDWWNANYSSLLTELCTGMYGLELSFGTQSFLGKENLIANAGVTLYDLNYNNLGTSTFNSVFGTNIQQGRELKVKGKLVALHFNVAKSIPINQNWTIQPGINLNYVYSFYGSLNSELINNDALSYKLNSWLRNYLEGLFLPTAMIEIRYKF